MSAAARVALLALGAGFALAAGFPESALRPIEALVAQMRSPQQAVPVARSFFVVASALSVLVALLWPALRSQLARGLDAIDAWPARRFWWTVGGLAAMLRIVAALALPYEPTSDAQWYHEVAASLARGEGFTFASEPTAYRSPGYPLLLSLLYRAFGAHVELAWVLGLAATALLLASVHRVAALVYGSSVARVATLLAAVYPALVLMTGQALSDLPFAAGLFAALAYALHADGDRLRPWFALGVGIGLLTLLRSVGAGLVFVLPAVAWLRGFGARRTVAAVIVAAAGCAVCVLPWMARNAVALDRFTIGTNAGSNLLVGNRAGASGWRDAFELPPRVAAASGEVARDDAMKQEAWRFVREHPSEALQLLPRKLIAMYLLETQAVSSLFQGERRAGDGVRFALYAASQLAWGVIALLVAARIVSWRDASGRPQGGAWAGWWLVAYFTAVCLVFHGEDRYRLPVLPWFLVEAAAVVALARQPRSRSMRPLSSSRDAN